MFKRLTALFVILTMIVTFMTSGFASGISPYTKNGFRLVAQDTDATGIAVDTEFILETEKNFSVEEIRAAFSIDGEPAPKIAEMDTNMFSIHLARPLMENSLYTFRMSTDIETTWVFQTQSAFKIISSLPAEKSTNVPVNTGIEITFSHENFSDIKDHFEITPKVSGRFEIHKKTAVFVPDQLEYNTVYTVTIRKGISIIGTKRTIDEDYVFSFETQQRATNSTPAPGEITTNLNVGRYLYDFSSEEKPDILIRYSIYNNGGGAYKQPVINIKSSIYAYKDFDSFFDAIEKKNATPYWARSYNTNFVPVDNLQKVLEFEQVINEGSTSSYGDGHLIVPATLPEGYYVLDGYYKDVRIQTFLQITNTGIYLSQSNTKTLVWLNDLITKKPINGASISFSGYDQINYSKSDGVAYFDTVNMPSDSNNAYYGNSYNRYYQYMIVTTKEGKSSLIDCSSYSYGNKNSYWSYFHTDRGMYKPEDTINIWGYIKNRYKDEDISYLTLEIRQNYYSTTPPVVKQTINVNNSFFEGAVKLPDLPEGYYYITVKKGSETVINHYFRVENYIKPSYKMEITKDKNAIFVDEEANFNIKSSFFEGTGVSNLDVTYYFDSYSLGGSTANTTKKSDLKGNLKVSYSPYAKSDIQGEHSVRLNARATLPESGQINASSYLRVFVNDINVQTNGKIKEGMGTISAQVNEIDLSRINDGTAKDNYDYLGDAVGGKNITGTIYKNTWIKTEAGTYYDYINKVTHKIYNYKLQKEPVKTFSMTTSKQGYASYVFDAPEIPDTYYTAELNCGDGNGRKMTFTVYCGKQLDYYIYQRTDYILEGNNSSYGLGESVDLTFKYGSEPLTEGKFLYYKSQNGIYDYTIGASSSYSFNFSEREVPNARITGVQFNGNTYVSASYDAVFNIQEKNLTIEAKTDKDFYKPGDQVNISIDVKDKNGIPVKSTVNLSVVDEAFFALLDQKIDVLSSLYTYVNHGVFYEGKSHHTANTSSWGRYDDKTTVPETATGGNGASQEPAIREDFRDTAQFMSIETDRNGKGYASFKLPDNITSWRVTLGAISEDLHAGSDKVNMLVTLPFFINYSFNTTYLEGDRPILGVNAYGSGLNENEDVTFEVTGSDANSPKLTVTGKAFERVNIPLWKLNEGKQDITIKAYSSKYSDALKHTFNVVKSYYQIEKAEFTNVTPGITIAGGKKGFTQVVFQDKSKGMFLWDLIILRYSYGNRVDQLVSNYIASQLIATYFPDYNNNSQLQKPSLSEYQKADGGLALLPYSASDLELTAKLTVLAKNMVNTQALSNYYYKVLEGNSSAGDKAKALYGLAVLKEPVLLSLEKVALTDNLSAKDLAYISLAYYELGDISTAEQLYNERIYPLIEEFTPYYRINTGGDKDDILETTSLCAYLAAKLKKPESEGLYEYCASNYAKDILLNAEKLMFISTQIENTNTEPGKLTYSLNGETKTITFENGSSYSLSLLPSQLADLKITGVEGAVSAVSIFKEDIMDTNTVDDDISIRRTYMFSNGVPLSSNTLKQGDVIKVRLEWNMSNAAFDGVYEITDYLPSGLKPYNSYYNTEGQKISFYIYNSTYWQNRNYIEYYARVISPGTYTAQGPVIQGKSSRDNINFGKTETVVIDAVDPILTPIEDLPVPTPTPGKDILYGDLNGDGKVNSIDFGHLRMYLLGLTSQLAMPLENGDLNGDGKINSIDLALMRQYLLGYIKKFPVQNS